MFCNFLINNIIHHLESFHSLLFSNSHVLLLQGNWPETVVKEEQSFAGVHTQKCCHVFIVRKCCTETNKSNIFLGGLNVTDSSVEYTSLELRNRNKWENKEGHVHIHKVDIETNTYGQLGIILPVTHKLQWVYPWLTEIPAPIGSQEVIGHTLERGDPNCTGLTIHTDTRQILTNHEWKLEDVSLTSWDRTCAGISINWGWLKKQDNACIVTWRWVPLVQVPYRREVNEFHPWSWV